MSGPEPTGHEAGESVVRAIVAVLCAGGVLLLIALVVAMDRWMLIL